MSLFQFKISSLDRERHGIKNTHGKTKIPTKGNILGSVTTTTTEAEEDNPSQFVIDESDLWNDDDDDNDIFEPKRNKKDQKRGLPNCAEKESERVKETVKNFNEKNEGMVDENMPNFILNAEDNCKNLAKTSPFEVSKDKSEKQNEINFDLCDYGLKFSPIKKMVIEDSDDDILPERIGDDSSISKSPTFDVSCKSIKRYSCTQECRSNDSGPENYSQCSISTALGNTLSMNMGNKSKGEDKSSTFNFFKDNLNALGLAEETDQWLGNILQNEAFSNVTPEICIGKLEKNLNFLNKVYIEILEKVMAAFENLPLEMLNQFPEFDQRVFTALRTTRSRVKAIIIKTDNLIKRKKTAQLDDKQDEEKNADCFQLKSFTTKDYSPALNTSHISLTDVGVDKSSGCAFAFKLPSKLNKSLTESKIAFPTLNSSTPNALMKSDSFARDSLKSSTPLPHREVKPSAPTGASEVIDYTDTLYKTPPKNCDGSDRFLSLMRNNGASGEFDGINFPHSKELLEKFHQKFGLRSFRPNQLQVINAALLGHDCFVLMPTGGGKSLCYQLPALVSKGLTVVVSPLRSLILDQVTKLLTLDIAAAHLCGDVNESDASSVYRKLNQPEPTLKLLYVTPEKIGASSILRNCLLGLYKRNMLARFVIDEAHCVSQWGHDFRPDYKKLRELRENYPKVNMMALTATATPRVRTDILHQLKITNPKWFLSSFNRSNLVYSVREKKGKSTLKEIANLILEEFKKDTGVIYCLSRKECETVAEDLNKFGIKAIPYHAGLNDQERTRAQNLWMNDKVKVVCATIAFGMGIDKVDVRFVIHFSLPKSIEGYYQESGRAGRDGMKATCILFYSYKDKIRMLKLINMDQTISNQAAKKVHLDNLFRVVAFAENKTDCRRALQLEYFGEKFNRKHCIEDRSTACDNCLQQGVYELIDVTEESKAIVSTVKDVCGVDDRRNANFTMLHFVEVFKGALQKKIFSEGHDKLPFYGMGKSWQRLDVERLFRKLILEEFLKERLLVKDDGITFAYVKYGRRGEELLQGNMKIMFEVKKRKESVAAQRASTINEERIDPAVLEIQEKCYTDLLGAIQEIASSINCNPNAIMNVQALRAMSRSLPETAEEMLSINHVTTANFEKYGSILLEITTKYSAEKKSLVIAEAPEEAIFMDEPWQNKNANESPYFETEITYVGKGRGGKKRKKPSNFRKPQNAKKWKGGSASGKASSSKTNAAKSNAKSAAGVTGCTTVPGAKFSTLMELPTSKSRFDRPKVVFKNL